MKKLFTLVIALGSVAAVFAQSGYRDGRDAQNNTPNANYNHSQPAQGGNYGSSSYGQRGGGFNQGYNDHQQGGAVNNNNYSNYTYSNSYGERNNQWGNYGRGDDKRDDQYRYRDERDQRSRRMSGWNRFNDRRRFWGRGWY